mgnify:CR=1 FL=1
MIAAVRPQARTAVPFRPLFIAIIALGSFLLFLVQPLVARLVLPVLGGSPSVWNTAMVFYQAVLLGGYAYAHLLSRLRPALQVAVHVALFAAAALTLPVGIADLGPPETGAAAPLWLLRLLGLSIGPLFLVVSAQAPLMQAWFARSADPQSGNPWFLYAASNAGSLAGLLCYPFLLEPFTTLPLQQALWSAGFLLLLALVALAGWQIAAAAPAAPATAPALAPPVAFRRRLRWLLLAAVPSGLMLSTTTHITTDIMAMPLLWVIPLAAYLLSFILVFSTAGAKFFRVAREMAPPALLLFGGAGFLATASLASFYGLASVLLLLVVATALHGALAADRPAAAQLTGYYLWIALGGVVGGLFAALVAPLVFDWTWEHPILLLAAALLVPARPLTRRIGRLWTAYGLWSRLLRILAPPLSLLLGWWLGAVFAAVDTPALQMAAVAVLAGLGVLSIGRPIQFTWHLAMLMLALGGWQQIDISTIPFARQRSFFGIYTIENSHADMARRLLHGTTLHGAQSLNPALSRQPMTYYAPNSGIGRAMRAAPRLFGSHARIGVVGLGTGTLTCYATGPEDWTIFEIDPLVVRLATNPDIFSYVHQCRPDVRIVLGDARLTLAAEPPGRFDLLAVDAFSSDAIPLHLLTTQAFANYFRHLSPDGVLLVHISNRVLDLEPVVAAIADALGLSARIYFYMPGDDQPPGLEYNRSIWVALTRNDAAMARFTAAAGDPANWARPERRRHVEAWTDEYASVLPVVKGLW